MTEHQGADPNAHNKVEPENRGPGMDEPVHYTYVRPEEKPPHRDVRLVDAVKNGNLDEARRLIESGANIHQRAEQDWTPLNFAAGKGDPKMVRLLLEHGADLTVTGRDRRTPRKIARAAGRKEVADLLEQEEKKRGVWQDPAKTERYCKGYYLRDLRKFEGWREERKNWNIAAYWSDDIKASFDKQLEDTDVVFIHQDYSVTRSMWHGEHVIFDGVSAAWVSFCQEQLKFPLPNDPR
jgi:hypothetical protein